MKKFLLSAFLFFTVGICIAQPGEWVWVHGSNLINTVGVFGVQGISDPANNPPGLYEPAEWTDQNGNFWFYGGLGPGYDEFGDVWKYNPSINQWVWMKGTGVMNSPVNYGAQGIPSPTNDPGSRSWGAATWVDNTGNFWMFGGSATGVYADLWKYEPSTNNWTWMKGPQGFGNTGVYGIQGIPDPANYPPCRYESAATWTDNANNLWLFGGYDLTATLNDLWRYNISTNEWTWMKGSNFSGALDVYGLQGVEDPVNTPGSRATYAHWKDLNGNFWIFGGTSIGGSGLEYNDLWRFNSLTNNWAWFKGGSSYNGIYGIQCLADSANTPGYRHESRASFTDSNGNFWLFAGGMANAHNDLWMYCVNENKWIWVSGDSTTNPVGNWGTMGISSPLNKPNGRAGNVMWSDQAGSIYVFGGTSNWPDTRGDMWKFTIDPACASCSSQPIALFNAPNQICPGTCTDFTNNSISSTSYQWNFPGGNPAVSTDVNPASICYNTPGTYDVTLIASNGASSDTLTLVNYITVFQFPAPQGISQSGDTLFAIAGAVSYQWYHDGILVSGATDYFYVAPVSGNYNVVATDVNGCEVEAVIFDVIAATSPLSLGEGSGVRLFPNPVSDLLEIRNLKTETSIKVYNTLGMAVSLPTANCKLPTCFVDVSSLSAGIYFLEITDGIISSRKIFTKK
jgi:PKD repeat protein